MFYNWHRDYNPALGRYVQSDPIGLQGGINSYGYVGSSPLRFVDSAGLQFAPPAPPAPPVVGPGTIIRPANPAAPGGIDTGDPRASYPCSGSWSYGVCYPSLGDDSKKADPSPTPGASDGSVNEWELELELHENGPKDEFHKCTNNFDRDCKKRFIDLTALYYKILKLSYSGVNTSVARDLYNKLAERYHRECLPYWKPVPMFTSWFSK